LFSAYLAGARCAESCDDAGEAEGIFRGVERPTLSFLMLDSGDSSFLLLVWQITGLTFFFYELETKRLFFPASILGVVLMISGLVAEKG